MISYFNVCEVIHRWERAGGGGWWSSLLWRVEAGAGSGIDQLEWDSRDCTDNTSIQHWSADTEELIVKSDEDDEEVEWEKKSEVLREVVMIGAGRVTPEWLQVTPSDSKWVTVMCLMLSWLQILTLSWSTHLQPATINHQHTHDRDIIHLQLKQPVSGITA